MGALYVEPNLKKKIVYIVFEFFLNGFSLPNFWNWNQIATGWILRGADSDKNLYWNCLYMYVV